MKAKKLLVFTAILFLVLFEALSHDTTENYIQEQSTQVIFENLKHQEKLFVPLISAKSLNPQAQRNTFVSSLVISNNSNSFPLYVDKVDYYNSEGSLQIQYLEKSLSIKPLSSIRFLINPELSYKENNTGFLVSLASDVSLSENPFYSVKVINSTGQSESSFASEGILINDIGYSSFPEY